MCQNICPTSFCEFQQFCGSVVQQWVDGVDKLSELLLVPFIIISISLGELRNLAVVFCVIGSQRQ